MIPERETAVTGVAYGGCIEPGGMELTDETWLAPCPAGCGRNARYFRWERAEGSLNVYTGFRCDCGTSRCDPWWPDDVDTGEWDDDWLDYEESWDGPITQAEWDEAHRMNGDG